MSIGSERLKGERLDHEGPKEGKPSAEETKNPSWKAKTIALSDWSSRAEAPDYVPSLSKSDAAKLQKTSDNLQAMLQEMSVQRL